MGPVFSVSKNQFSKTIFLYHGYHVLHGHGFHDRPDRVHVRPQMNLLKFPNFDLGLSELEKEDGPKMCV